MAIMSKINIIHDNDNNINDNNNTTSYQIIWTGPSAEGLVVNTGPLLDSGA